MSRTLQNSLVPNTGYRAPSGTFYTADATGAVVIADAHVQADQAFFVLLGFGVPGGDGAPVNSPAFTGVPTAPTAADGTSTDQLATTAFVQSAQVNVSGGGWSEAIPTTGQTISLGTNGAYYGSTNIWLIDPAGTLLALTVDLPTPTDDGAKIFASFSQIITGLTIGNANFAAAGLSLPTSAAVGDCFKFAFSLGTGWARFE